MENDMTKGYSGTYKKRNIMLAIAFAAVLFMAAAIVPTGVSALIKNETESAASCAIKTESGQVLAVVSSKSSAQAVITGLRLHYCGDMEDEQNSQLVTPLKIESLGFSDSAAMGMKVMTANEAVDHIVEMNETSTEPAVQVQVKSVGTKTKAIKHKTRKVRTDKLYRGTKRVTTKGSDGEKEVTASSVAVNGEVRKETVISSEVTKEPVTKVVLKGTSGIPVTTDEGTTGEQVVKYALKWLGNPYVWGGESLTKGCDCSGFTMLVYGHFGVSIPHYSYSQEDYGREVKSLSEAKAGDLICYGDHVAIYMGNDKMVAAANPKDGITIGTADYRKIVTIRRLV